MTAPNTTVSDNSPFAGMSLNRLKEIVTNTIPQDYELNDKFYSGDHWQDGEGWVGPIPPDTATGASEVKKTLQKGFLSKNVIREIIDRHTNGVLGRAPVWSFASKEISEDSEIAEADKAVIAEVEQAFTSWWDKRKVHDKLKLSLSNMLQASRSVARIYIAMGKTIELENGEAGIPEAATLEEALNYIFPDVPDPDVATVYNDPDTDEELGIYLYRKVDPATGKESNQESAELSYLVPVDEEGNLTPDENGEGVLTLIRNLEEGADTIVPIEMGGRITMNEIKRQLFITEQIRSQQKALNLALSMIPRNVVTGGFLERIIMNAEMPGEWEYKDGKPIKFHPAKFVTGAGTTNVLQGTKVEQPDGKTTLANPDVKWRDPSPVKPAVDAAQAIYLAMLEEAKQAHIILSGEALVSGKSREQARADFDMSLNESKIPCEQQGQWMLMAALSLAETLMNKTGFYTSKVYAVFQCHTFTGPVTWEERKQNDESIGKTMSQQRAMEANGILDVDAEMARITQENGTSIEHIKKQIDAWKEARDGGMTAEAAGKLVGFSDEVIKMLKQLDEVALEQQQEIAGQSDTGDTANAQE